MILTLLIHLCYACVQARSRYISGPGILNLEGPMW